MNDPSDTTAHDEDLLYDLEGEFMELAGKGDYGAVTYAIQESDSFMCVLKGVAMSILRNKAAGHKTLLQGLHIYVAPRWAAEQYPTRVAEMKAAQEDSMDEAEANS